MRREGKDSPNQIAEACTNDNKYELVLWLLPEPVNSGLAKVNAYIVEGARRIKK